MPIGGTTGQILRKASSTNFDAVWTDFVAGTDYVTVAQVVSVQDSLQAEIDEKEAALGNPAADGYVLSSLMDGTRSWIPAGGGGGSIQLPQWQFEAAPTSGIPTGPGKFFSDGSAVLRIWKTAIGGSNVEALFQGKDGFSLVFTSADGKVSICQLNPAGTHADDADCFTFTSISFSGDAFVDGGIYSLSANSAPFDNGVQAEVRTKGDKQISINPQAGDYTLALGDFAKLVRFNSGSAVNVTVPPNSDVSFPWDMGGSYSETGGGNGCAYVYLRSVGSGLLTVVAGSGVTVNTPQTLTLRAQFSSAKLTKVGTNEWDLEGDLTPV